MSYMDGYVAAVSDSNRDTYVEFATRMAAIFKEHGAVRVVECWGDDVPEGKLTDFRRAVKAETGESIVFSWIEWPSRAARDAGWKACMEDARMQDSDMPFDGKRMIYGGFATVVDV
ncbi:MAG: DUF1428 domain-containing protein [Brevundimonas sp.]|jgi:uncharacterized protein YbaA (DUF1428 family)|uniref:DUF1428 domain-containing protein n=1 Tax=Brevundimonas sp. TaxID=1871086 RepID=UPI00391877DD